jgi:hypothetical protein
MLSSTAVIDLFPVLLLALSYDVTLTTALQRGQAYYHSAAIVVTLVYLCIQSCGAVVATCHQLGFRHTL